MAKVASECGRSPLKGVYSWRHECGNYLAVRRKPAKKTLFAKAALQAPHLLLLDEPTKGVDIGAKAEIYRIIETLAREKRVAVIVVSSEEEELIEVADNITVFRSGRCDGRTFPHDSVTPAQLRELTWADATPQTAR